MGGEGKKGIKDKKGIVAEFKEFISRGNVIDLAVGVIVGSAFTAIVNSLVKDVVMPAIGWLIGGLNFEDYKLVLTPAAGDVPESAVYYGSFIQNVVNFFIIALVVFLAVKVVNRLRRKKEEPPKAEPPKPSQEVLLLTEIRDLLRNGNTSSVAENFYKEDKVEIK